MTAGTAPLTRVEDSGIHGKGLFATANIPADTLIMSIEGKKTSKDGIYVIWIETDDGPEGFEITSDARYVNHDANPNAIFYDDELWSLRRIRKGEEITHHYGDDWNEL